MRAVRLEVKPFEFISFLEVKCSKALNEHGTIKITGMIGQENSQKYMQEAARETWISVNAISENEDIRRFFAGILTGLQIRKEGQVCIMTIEAKTGSFLLDIEKHTRSFQDAGFYYSHVIDACIGPEGETWHRRNGGNSVIGGFLMQYRETDWEFMKRLASYAGTFLIPEDSFPEKKIYWGCQNAIAQKIESDSYRIEREYGNTFRYVVRTREIYNLGEQIEFDGVRLIVGRAASRLEGQELYHEYYLISETGGSVVPVYHHFTGLSLKARVTAVEKTVVQIRIEEDENKEACGSRWFDFATVYSTPDGAGWYCMPEVGDEVRIVFPDDREEHAYIASSVHLNSSGGRNNPEEKSWKNRQNKEVLFTPDAIVIRNNNGMLVELSDTKGISLVSDKDIIVQSGGNIQINSQGAQVSVFAGERILMQQGAAKVQVDDEINICGGKIYLN